MKFSQIVGISLLSGIVGVMVAQLVLPAFVSAVAADLSGLNIVDTTNIISWAAILLTLFALSITVGVLAKDYKPGPLFMTLGLAFLMTVICLCAGSYLYLAWQHPEVFGQTSLATKLLKFYAYPTLVALVLADPEPIWIASTVLFLFTFNLSVYYVIGGN